MQPTKQTRILEAQSATTQEQVHSLLKAKFPLTILLEHSPYCRKTIEERRELVRQAAPLYKELLSSVPYYANRPLDDPFWSAYVGSRAVAAMQMVDEHLKSMGRSTPEPAPTPSPEVVPDHLARLLEAQRKTLKG